MLGCGNSRLSEDVSSQKGPRKFCLFKKIYLKLWEDGYRNVVNTDVHLKFLLTFCDLTGSMLQYSGVLIEQMKKRHSALRPEMECMEYKYSLLVPLLDVRFRARNGCQGFVLLR